MCVWFKINTTFNVIQQKGMSLVIELNRHLNSFNVRQNKYVTILTNSFASL